jgi:DNA-binding transcriptional regulator YhcF (GntR family)
MGSMDKTPDSAKPAFVQLLKQRLQAVATRALPPG